MNNFLYSGFGTLALTIFLLILAIGIARIIWTLWLSKKLEVRYDFPESGSMDERDDLAVIEREARNVAKYAVSIERHAAYLRLQQLQEARKHELSDKRY